MQTIKAATILLAAVLTPSLFPNPALAAPSEWPKLEGLPFTQRLAVTIENPSDANLPAALIQIPLASLAPLLTDAKPGQLAVAPAEPITPKPKRDAADQNFVPSQESLGHLIFTLPLKPREKKDIYLYTTPTPSALPGYPAGTSYDSRHAYRSFENRYAAFRIETGPGSNTTGMAIDLFGKTKQGIGLRLAELYQQGHDAYHNLQYWGVDILKVGQGPGLGGVYLFDGDQMARPHYASIQTQLLYTGPVATKLSFTAPLELAGKKYTLTRYLTLVANDRSLHDHITIDAGSTTADLSHLTVAVGLRDLPNCTWSEDPKTGTALMTGDANQPHYKAVALGLTFTPKAFIKIQDLPDKKDFGHLYILGPEPTGPGIVSSDHRLAYLWDMDGQLPSPVNTAAELKAPLQSFLTTYAAERDNPVKIHLGNSPESAPTP